MLWSFLIEIIACKPIILSCILFMFVEVKFVHCNSCVIFAMKSTST